jgi:hypothetical protein
LPVGFVVEIDSGRQFYVWHVELLRGTWPMTTMILLIGA